MRAEDLRAVLLVRAVEESDRAGALLTPAERAAATRAARREHRGSDELEALLPARAHRLLERLLPRDAAIASALALTRGPRWLAPALILLAAGSGFALSALDGTRSINILGFPVLGLVLWNLAVYALLILRPTLSVRFPSMAWRLRAAPGPLAGALARFHREWFQAARPLYLARASRVLHLAALALALGLIGGLYLRGLVLEYQAVWASTFLDARAVHGLVSILYGPASLVTRVPIPGVEELETIRAQGESAARWIHLMAGTVALFVVIPRAVLAGAASAAIAGKHRDLESPSDLQPYFRTVFAEDGLGRATVLVMPYAYEPLPHAIERLRARLPELIGGEPAAELEAATPYGEEDALLAQLDVRAGAGADVLVLLFSLAATPEEENHGTLVAGARDLLARHRPRAEVVVMVDEAPYAARLGGGAGGAQHRLAERRALWQAFARAHGAEARFVDLGAA